MLNLLKKVSSLLKMISIGLCLMITVNLCGQDSLKWYKLSEKEYYDYQIWKLQKEYDSVGAKSNDISAHSFSTWLGAGSNLLGLLENMTDKDDFDPKDAVSAWVKKRRHFVKLEKDCKKGKLSDDLCIYLKMEGKSIKLNED